MMNPLSEASLAERLKATEEQLADSLEQQLAVSRILAAINQGSGGAASVFDAILASALRLCDGLFADVFISDGTLVHLAAHNFSGAQLAGDQMALSLKAYPLPLKPEVLPARVILNKQIVHFPDIDVAPNVTDLTRSFARDIGFRCGLFVPMVRDGVGIGAIGVARAAPGPFSDRQIQLLKTFADQAAMALDHTRLVTELAARNHELTEALSRQEALNSLLATVNEAPGDDQIIYQAVTDIAVRLCNASSGSALRYDGDMVHLMASTHAPAAWLQAAAGMFPAPPSTRLASLRAVFNQAPVNIGDIELDVQTPASTRELSRRLDYRSLLSVPMMRIGQAVGVITLAARLPNAFTERHVALLQSFADQAVIAIDRAGLIKQLEARTVELTESVGELTALNEVSRALGASLEPEVVLQTILQLVMRIGAIDGSSIYEYDEAAEVFTERASLHLRDITGGVAARVRKGEGSIGRLALAHVPVEIHDIATDAGYSSRSRASLLAAGFHSLLALPLVRESKLIGGLIVCRKAAGPFEARTIESLRTFAAQSALAIENSRLYRELRDKSVQLELASRHKSEFLANMSHELRTPLNAVIGFSEALIERYFGELNDKQDEYVRDIQASGAHLLVLINDILDLSKIEAGHMELSRSEFDLAVALNDALALIKERAHRQGVALRLECDAAIGLISADQIKIKQTLLNLLSNAVKFTPAGGSVRVVAERLTHEIRVAIIDTGAGIAPEHHATVFEEFRQVGNDQARRAEGTGLGLPLAKRLIELHGGTISLNSALGQGSTFTIRLPVAAAEA